jgi:hypothetical protein
MLKDRILTAFEIDNTAYLGTCKAIGLKDPIELKGLDLANFEMVRDWWNEKTVKNHGEAASKFKEWQKAQGNQGAEDVLSPEILALIKSSAVDSMQDIPNIIRSENSATLEQARLAFRRYQLEYAKSPEFQSSLAQAIDCEVLEDKELPGEPHYPALLEQSAGNNS